MAINLKEYKAFVDTGVVDNSTMLQISKKVAKFEDLNKYEYNVFVCKVDIVNEIMIKNKNKPFELWEF